MLRVRQIEAHGFLGHDDVCIDFDKPVTFVSGRNGSGKSSLAHALCVALLGRARGVLRKDRSALNRGDRRFKVAANIEVNDHKIRCIATPSDQVPSTTEIQRMVGPSHLIQCLTSWEHWWEMKDEARHKMLLEVAGGADWQGDPLMGEIEVARKTSGLSVALRKATEGRRRMARMVNELGSEARPMPPEGPKRENLTTRLQELLTEQKRLQDRLLKASNLSGAATERKGRLESEIAAAKEAKTIIEDLNSADSSALRAQEVAYQGFYDAQQHYSAIESKIKDTKELLGLGDAYCPTCGKQVEAEDQSLWQEDLSKQEGELDSAASQLDVVETAYANAQAAKRVATGELREADMTLNRGREAYRELQHLEARIEEAEKLGLDLNDVQMESQIVASSVANCRKSLADWDAFDAAVTRWGEVSETADNWRKHHDEFERCEGLLKTTIESGAGDAVSMMRLVAGKAAKQFDWELDWSEDMLPCPNGRPFALLSRSEKYLALVLTQFALSEVSGLRFLLVDDLDILTPLRRKQFKAWLDDEVLPRDFQVIAMVANDQTNPMSSGSFQIVAI